MFTICQSVALPLGLPKFFKNASMGRKSPPGKCLAKFPGFRGKENARAAGIRRALSTPWDPKLPTGTAKNQAHLSPATGASRAVPGPPRYPRAYIVASNGVDKLAQLAGPSPKAEGRIVRNRRYKYCVDDHANAESCWWIWSVVLRKRSTRLAFRGIQLSVPTSPDAGRAVRRGQNEIAKIDGVK
jgi:hypothetical protein